MHGLSEQNYYLVEVGLYKKNTPPKHIRYKLAGNEGINHI